MKNAKRILVPIEDHGYKYPQPIMSLYLQIGVSIPAKLRMIILTAEKECALSFFFLKGEGIAQFNIIRKTEHESESEHEN